CSPGRSARSLRFRGGGEHWVEIRLGLVPSKGIGELAAWRPHPPARRLHIRDRKRLEIPAPAPTQTRGRMEENVVIPRTPADDPPAHGFVKVARGRVGTKALNSNWQQSGVSEMLEDRA